MQESLELSGALTVLPAEPSRKGRPLLAWFVIVALVGLTVWQQGQRPAPAARDKVGGLSDQLMRMQARYVVGAARMMGDGALFYAQTKPLNTGPPEQRLRYLVLAGELAGPEEALTQWRRWDKQLVENKIELSPTQARLRDMLGRLYAEYAAGSFDLLSLDEAETQELQAELGWFSELALAPADGPDPEARRAALAPALRVFFVTIGMVLLALLLGLVGLIALILFLVLLFLGKLRCGFTTGSPNGGLYAETFAVWLVLFLGLSWLAAQLVPREGGLLATLAVMLLSLAALAWPVLRGVPWRQVREEIGLTAGRRPLLEPFLGIGTYAMALPLAAVGILVMVLLLRLQSDGGPMDPDRMPTHPIAEVVVRADFWGRLLVLLLACVAAPLLEEIVFRGVLYRHVREATGRFGFAVSVLSSAAFVSVIFAVIHPQGMMAVPVLAALATAFTLAREWRGTLVPAMVAHGLSNGLVMLLLLQTMGD